MAKLDHPVVQLYAALPNLNIWNMDDPGTGSAFFGGASRRLHRPAANIASAVRASLAGIDVLDEVAPGDTLLLSMDSASHLALLKREPGIRLVPVSEVEPLWLKRARPSSSAVPARSSGATISVEVGVVDALSGAPLAGSELVGYLDKARNVGDSATTDIRGVARLEFPPGTSTLESLEAYPPGGHWPAVSTRVGLRGNGPVVLRCEPVNPKLPDPRAFFGLEGKDSDGSGVTVGVIDTGVSDHPDVVVRRGLCVVQGENPADYDDDQGHGTHVAGIVCGRAQPGSGGVRGVAPAASLNAYRVFPRGGANALSFNIAKAIRMAVDDGCDLINLSLGGGADMQDVLREILRARAMGVVCVAASGNDYRSPVSYPARYSQVLAVSAFGRQGTWPAGAAQAGTVEKPPHGADSDNFLASFSNIGPETGFTGPGVAVVSTFPGGYAVMDGTSMACPAVTGALARLLARNKRILTMSRNQKRSDAIVRLAMMSAQSLGFGPLFEGAGRVI